MKSITIKGSVREIVGKKATKALRNAEMVPCVLYGGKSPIHFSATEMSFKGLVYTPNAHTVVVDLDNGEKISAILQDIQFHPVSDKILHIDLLQLFDDKIVNMNIPVTLEGSAPGVLNGGNLLFRKRKLSLKALPGALPDSITVNISELKIGDKVAVKDILNEKYTFLHPDNTVIVQVKTSRNAVEDEEGEEGEEGEGEATEAAAE